MHSYRYPACTKIDTLFWLIFRDFQNEVFSSNLNISANCEPNQAFYRSKSKLAYCQLKTISMLEVKDFILMLHSNKQQASFYSPGMNQTPSMSAVKPHQGVSPEHALCL